ncbi:MAG: hypothetical protein ABFD97_18095 [Syntrophobacter sp.]
MEPRARRVFPDTRYRIEIRGRVQQKRKHGGPRHPRGQLGFSFPVIHVVFTSVPPLPVRNRFPFARSFLCVSVRETAAHTISATFAIDSLSISASAGDHGSISPSGQVSVDYGANRTFTITPDPQYHIVAVSVDGASVGAVTSYSFTNVTAAHGISATFAIDTLSITTAIEGGSGGTITPRFPDLTVWRKSDIHDNPSLELLSR